MDPNALPDPGSAPAVARPTPMGLPDLQTPPTQFGGNALPVQGPAPAPVTIDAVLGLLRNDRLRGFRIDVETDSLIEADQQKEKAQRTEFVQSVGEFIAKVGPIAQAMPPLAPLVGGLLQFAVRGFKVGQELEELIETTMHKAGMLLENPPPKQMPPEEQAKVQMTQVKAQAEIQKAQIGIQVAQIDGQSKIASANADIQALQAKHQTEMQALAQKHETTTAQMLMQMQHDRERHQMAMAEHHAKMQHAEQQHHIGLQAKQVDVEAKKQLSTAKVNAKAGKTAEGQPNELQQMAEIIKALHAHATAPKEILRDDSGRVIGVKVGGQVKKAKRDGSGRVTSIE